MSATQEVIDGLKEVRRMTGDLKRTAEAVKALAIEVREHDRQHDGKGRAGQGSGDPREIPEARRRIPSNLNP